MVSGLEHIQEAVCLQIQTKFSVSKLELNFIIIVVNLL